MGRGESVGGKRDEEEDCSSELCEQCPDNQFLTLQC